MSIKEYEEFHRRSLEALEGFWMEQARGIEWRKEPERALDFDNPPFAYWFVGGETNVCTTRSIGTSQSVANRTP